MKKYNIIDDEGYTWLVKEGVWSHRKVAINDRDWESRKKNMTLISALILKWLMRMEGLKVTIKPST